MLKWIIILLVVFFTCGADAGNRYPPGTVRNFLFSFGDTYIETEVREMDREAEYLRRRGWTAIVGWISGRARLQTNRPFATVEWNCSALFASRAGPFPSERRSAAAGVSSVSVGSNFTGNSSTIFFT